MWHRITEMIISEDKKYKVKYKDNFIEPAIYLNGIFINPVTKKEIKNIDWIMVKPQMKS